MEAKTSVRLASDTVCMCEQGAWARGTCCAHPTLLLDTHTMGLGLTTYFDYCSFLLFSRGGYVWVCGTIYYSTQMGIQCTIPDDCTGVEK